MDAKEMDPARVLAVRRDWEVDTYLVYTYQHGVLGAYRTFVGAETAARVISQTAPYVNIDVKVTSVDLNEYIDVTASTVGVSCSFLCGERQR